MARRRLNSLEKAELIALVKDMMGLSADNKLFVRSALADAGDIEVEKYKKKISRALSYNMRGTKDWDLKEAGRIIWYLEKATADPMIRADVYVHTVVQGHRITDELGDIDQDYYHTMEDFYEGAAKWVLAAQMQGHDISRLKESLHEVMLKAQGIGWGYCDELSSLWSEYFGNKDVE
ncbi:MAG: hypothetical protein PWR29_606 [Methanolobus sp.]|nr:hypothetical protein [Methanolobus sp.]